MNNSTHRSLIFLFIPCLLLNLCLAEDDFYLSLLPRTSSSKEKHLSDKLHGVIMGLTVVLIFPLGAISRIMLQRVLSPRSLLWVHVGSQILGLVMLLTGLGLGAWVAVLHAEVYNDPQGHAILGTIIVILFLIQPFIGLWHHRLYRADKPNNMLRYGHIWFGRALIILGMIEGGLGLWLAANSPGGEKAYGVLAGIIGIVYIVLVMFWYFNKESDSRGKGGNDAGEVDKPNEYNGPGVHRHQKEMM